MILDTNAFTSLLSGDAAVRMVLNAGPGGVLPVIAIGEYRSGLPSHRHGESLRARLNAIVLGSVVLEVETLTAEHYAEIRHELKLQGTPIPTNDIWIAALARQHAMPVVTRDAHFDHVPGIARIGW